MKTYRHLHEQISDFANLYVAFRKARKGKRDRAEVADFEYNLEANLFQLQAELQDGTYQPGPYRNFYVRERKLRLISASPFRDRVAHHALCRVIDPIFEARFIHDTYACRVGKGTHAAVDRAQHFARGHAYVLQCDVHQFFPAIDHAILYDKLARLIADPQTLQLIARILDSGAGVLAPMYEMEWFDGDDLLVHLGGNGCVDTGRGVPPCTPAGRTGTGALSLPETAALFPPQCTSCRASARSARGQSHLPDLGQLLSGFPGPVREAGTQMSRLPALLR